jgi:ABC-type polysaccharide/polyol phosphate export permease/Tfp pilus assembly protein PilF
LSDIQDLQRHAQQAADAAERAPHNIGKLIQAARLQRRAGNTVRAIAFAREAVALDPANVRAVRALSGILNAVGERAEAIQFGKKAVWLDPANAEARLHLGGMLAAEQRWREAAEHLSVHVVLPGATPRGWRLLSTVLHQGGDTERAIDAARHAITADPNIIEYRLHLVSLLSTRGLYDAALEELATTQAQAPDNAVVWRMRSAVHASLDQLDQALLTAQRAVALAGDDPACRAQLDRVSQLCGLPVSHEPRERDPAAWSISPRRTMSRSPRRPTQGMSQAAAERWRVIHAIIMRDIRTKFGHSRLGYIWALVEPISHLGTLGVAFYCLNHSPPPVGDNLFLFYITGLVPFLMYSHVAHDVMAAADSNSEMLQLPIVKRTDVMVAQALRQFATEVCVAIIIFSIAALLGLQGMPADPLTAMAAMALLWLLAVGIGAFNMVVAGLYPSYETFYNSVIRLFYFTSGIYYTPIRMPEWVREILVWNPLLQGVEFFRSGFYHQYNPHWLYVNYLLTWVMASLCIGFALERALRGRMVPQT